MAQQWPNHPKTDKEKPVTWHDLSILVNQHARDRAAIVGLLQHILEVMDEGLLKHQKPFSVTKGGTNTGDVFVISNGDPARLLFSEINISCSGSLTGYFELVGERTQNFAQLTVTQNAGTDVGDLRLNANSYPLGNYAITIPSGSILQFVVVSASNVTFCLTGNLEYKPNTGTELYRGRGF